MKKVIVLMLLMVMGYTVQVQGGLMTIGTATYDDGLGGGAADYNLIWDDDNNGNSVVWLDYTNMANWADMNTWASTLDGALTYNVDAGYEVNWNNTNWRLPETYIEVGGYNITSSEMGHLYYTELGNAAGGPLSSTGDFQNLTSSVYWSGTEYSANPNGAWVLDFGGGLQRSSHKGTWNYVLAVRSGDVAVVPEPTTIALLGIGLAGLAGGAVRRRYKKAKKVDTTA